MKYTVLWSPDAETELAALWLEAGLEAADRDKIAESANEIDERLRMNAENEGESRSSGRRILIRPPLGVIFRVHSQDRLDCVLEVWTFDEPRHQ